jgi:hypothetical protein
MLPRRCLALFVLVAASAAALAVRAQSDDWQTVVGPDLRFRLEMPSPVDKSTAEAREKGHAAPRLAWEAKRGEQIFDFDYVDYDPKWFTGRDGKEMAKELGRGEAEKAFPREKYKYLKDEAVTLQGWDGYALDIESEDGGLVMMRTFIVRDRLYRLLVTAQADMRSRSAAVRFLESLRLAETRD